MDSSSVMHTLVSAKSKIFVHISGDNRIHVWDTDTHRRRRVYVDKNHLTHTYTCHAYHETTANHKEGLGLYAVGTSDGLVMIWDLTRGIVVKTIGTANSSATPTDIVFSNDGRSIFVATMNQDITQYDTSSGEELKTLKGNKRGNTKLAMNPKANVIAIAGSGIRLYETDAKNKKKLNVSVRGNVKCLTMSTCGRFLICAGENSREVLFYDIQESGSLDPRTVISVEGFPRLMFCQATSIAKGYIDILCIYENKGGCVIRILLDSTSGSERPSDSVSICSITSKALILSACFGNIVQETNGTTSKNASKSLLKNVITIAIGQTINPSFQQYSIESNEGILLKDINLNHHSTNNHDYIIHSDDLIETSLATTSESSGEVDNAKPEEPTRPKNGTRPAMKAILGPLDAGGVKRPMIDDMDDNDDDIEDMQSSKKQKSSREDGLISIDMESIEQTLEQRLESLSASMTRLEENALSSSHGPDAANEATPTTDSLVTLLEQALQSNDNSQLEQCLQVQDMDIVEETCRRLPSTRVISFLKKLVAKFEKSPSRGILLTRWLLCVLKYHTAFLISISDLSSQLSGLSQMLESRLSSYTRLSALGGRLDLLMAQISNVEKSTSRVVSTAPKQIFIED